MATIETALKSATKAGCENLARMIMALKKSKGIEWFAFTDWLSERSGIRVSKDILYRTASGFHKSAPSLETLLALARTPEFTYLDSTTHPSLEEISQIVVGERDACGQPISVEAQLQEAE